MKTTALRMVRCAVVVVVTAIFLLEAYTLIVEREGDTPLPANFGNFAANRAGLEKEPAKKSLLLPSWEIPKVSARLSGSRKS